MPAGWIEGHHDDYSQPLVVRWLCTRCHAQTHMARVRVDLRLPKELVEAVDEARGDVTRTRFIERALEKALGDACQTAGSAGEISPPAPSRASDDLKAPQPAPRDAHSFALERQRKMNEAKGL